MDVVKVRAYGLLPITKRAYLRVQTCCLSALAIALLWVALAPPDSSVYYRLADAAEPTEEAPIRIFAMLLDNALWILLAAALLGVVETWWMLRRFRAAELAQAQRELLAADVPAQP
jgi:hypothetical protein